MPPKVHYGKKRAASRPENNFSNFISPKKAGARTQDKAGDTQDWKQQLEVAATQNEDEDALNALEKSLAGLDLEQKPTKAKTTQTQKGGRPKKAHDGSSKDGLREKENVSLHVSEAYEPGDRLGHDPATEHSQKKAVKHGRRGRPRKALQDHGAQGVQQLDQKNSIDKTLGHGDPTQDGVITPPSTPAPMRKPRIIPTPVAQKQQLPTPKPSPEPEDIYTHYTAPLLSLSLGNKIISFGQWSTELEPHFEVTKIAEASFSEVYRLSAKSSTSVTGQESVLKVVALKTPPNAPFPCQLQARAVRDREGQLAKEMAERDENDAWKSDVADVLSEVKLLQNLNHIPGFTNFRDLTVLKGRPSPSFSDAWKAWNKSRPRGKKSEFPDPSKKSSYDDTQLWAIVEMQDAGTDCEKLMETQGLSSVWEIWDVFWGVCLSVAKAEEACRFEHRDLHMGNICVRPAQPKTDLTNLLVESPLQQKLRFTGLETTVIDYTLSRADILASPSHQSSPKTRSPSAQSTGQAVDAGVAYLDLDKDPALWEGDASEEYQYEIYRYMRGAALYNNPLQRNLVVEEVPVTPRRSPRKNTHIRFDEVDAPNHSPQKPTSASITKPSKNIWEDFHPKTNLVWTHFLLHKLMKHLSNSGNTPAQLSTKQIMSNIQAEDGTMEPIKVKKKALKLFKVLERVSELLCPVALGKEGSLGSVKELVVLALEERWLRVEDVAG